MLLARGYAPGRVAAVVGGAVGIDPLVRSACAALSAATVAEAVERARQLDLIH
jgi:hypothetical protein